MFTSTVSTEDNQLGASNNRKPKLGLYCYCFWNDWTTISEMVKVVVVQWLVYTLGPYFLILGLIKALLWQMKIMVRLMEILKGNCYKLWCKHSTMCGWYNIGCSMFSTCHSMQIFSKHFPEQLHFKGLVSISFMWINGIQGTLDSKWFWLKRTVFFYKSTRIGYR